MSLSTLRIETPRVFAPLLRPARYKGAHGGRGSGKSHEFAKNVIVAAASSPARIVCIREVQKSIRESVKRLLEDKIAKLGLGSFFDVLQTEIRGANGSLIIFQGMQDHTAESIKSLEGYDIAWVEEAQSLSAHSLRLLRPTIRKEGSELWFTWNPMKAEDPVDQLLRGDNVPSDAIVVNANWSDNPWFPDELNKERLFDLNANPDTYDHVWEGAYWSISDAQIFKDRVSIEAFGEPEKGTRLLYGADWGFANDPNVLVRCWIKDECLYIDYEAFGYGVELDELPQLFDSVPEVRKWPVKGDSARPETISHMAGKGFNITAAKKWQGSVEDGIAHMKGFKRIIVHPRCTNIAQEFRLYSFKVDKKTEDILPIIVDKYNHGIDAIRYALDGYIQRKGFVFLKRS